MAAGFANTVAADSRAEVTRFRPDQYRGFANLAEAFYHNANVNGDLIAYEQADSARDTTSARREYLPTYQSETKQRVLKIASQFEMWGVNRGDPVAILALNRPEWTEAEMAVYTVGAIAVAFYVRITSERLRHLIHDADAKCVVVENQELLEAVLRADEQLAESSGNVHSRVRHILTIEDTAQPVDRRGVQADVKSLSEVLGQPCDRSDQSFAWIHTNRNEVASVYYTSGSSGTPVGVPVTHGQVLENLHQIVAARLIDYRIYEGAEAPAEQPCVTLILPERAHAFPARTTQLVATSPARARYATIIDHRTAQVTDAYRDSIRRDLRDGAAGIVPIVPKVLITIQQRVRQRLESAGIVGRIVAGILENVTRKVLADSRGQSCWRTNLVYRLLSGPREKIARKIRERIVGPEFAFFISGGAKLPVETAAFLWALGMPVYEGYGSTESNCPVATNTPESVRLGSVGKPFAGMELRIDPSSHELWLRGPNVADHYWHQPVGNDSHWTADGWYRTRDIARQDGDGYLYIDDRVDNIFVLQNGENVSATAVEQRFVAIPYVDSVIVIGHHRPVLVALVSLCDEAIRAWARESGRQLGPDLHQENAVAELVRSEIERHVNRHAGQACERVRQCVVIESLAVENQTLTATEKVRRREVERRYAEVIEQLYGNPNDWWPAHGTEDLGTEDAVECSA